MSEWNKSHKTFTLKKIKLLAWFSISYLFLGFFLKMTLVLIEGPGLKKIDELILIFIADRLRSSTFTEIAVNITALGSPAFIFFFSILCFIILFIKKDKMAALFLAMNVIGATSWLLVLKNVIGRERPQVVPRLIEISGLSYPSGHSLVSTATYLSIAFLFYRRIDSKFLKILTLGMAGLIIFFIGFSRIYLGVHYPSDVLSGILFGISLVLWLIALFKSFSIF